MVSDAHKTSGLIHKKKAIKWFPLILKRKREKTELS